MKFVQKMIELKNTLEQQGHVVHVPTIVENAHKSGEETAQDKIEHDFIRKHYNRIEDSDAVLIANYTKNGIENYIGGNTFLEIGFAYVLGKKIFVLNPIPDMPYIADEVIAMQPKVLNGKVSL